MGSAKDVRAALWIGGALLAAFGVVVVAVAAVGLVLFRPWNRPAVALPSVAPHATPPRPRLPLPPLPSTPPVPGYVDGAADARADLAAGRYVERGGGYGYAPITQIRGEVTRTVYASHGIELVGGGCIHSQYDRYYAEVMHAGMRAHFGANIEQRIAAEIEEGVSREVALHPERLRTRHH